MLVASQAVSRYIRVTPFDDHLYQESINVAIRRGYPLEGDQSVRAHLRTGVIHAATAGVHLPHRPTQVWIALFTSCSFPAEISVVYNFNKRFIRGEPQGNLVIVVFADIIRQASELYRPLAARLITTSTLNVIAGMLVEHETRSMQVSPLTSLSGSGHPTDEDAQVLSAVQQYPTYQRAMSGALNAFSFMVFPQEIPTNDYIQALPELGMFVCNVNDVLSFSKEELVGETTNHACGPTKKSKLKAFRDLTQTMVGPYKRILEILEGAPEACGAFEAFTGGYVRFHTSSPRYRMEDLELKAV